MLLEHRVDVVRHLRHHRLDWGEEANAERRETGRSFRERDLRDPPQISEEHVRGSDQVRVDARRVRDSLEHHSFVHADSHLPEDALQEDLPLSLRRLTQEA